LVEEDALGRHEILGVIEAGEGGKPYLAERRKDVH
jgi:hypothetical protein